MDPAEADHALVLAMWSSPETQRRLEEARAQREKVLAAREAEKSAASPKVVASRPAVGPAYREPPAPTPVSVAQPAMLLSDTRRGAGAPSGLAVATAAAPQPRRRRSWPVSLLLGLSVGLAAGVGLMRLADAAPPWIRDALRQTGLPIGGVTMADGVGPSAPDPMTSVEEMAEEPALERPPWLPLQADPDRPAGRLARLVLPDATPDRPVVAPPGAPTVEVAWQPTLVPPGAAGEAVAAPAVLHAQAPQPRMAPLLRSLRPWFASPEATDAAPAPGLPATPTLVASSLPEPLRISLHLSPGFSEEALVHTQQTLTEAGFDLVATSAARFGVARSEVRFFHGADAPEATKVAESMKAQARDFSAYRPAPPPGTLELWLAS